MSTARLALTASVAALAGADGAPAAHAETIRLGWRESDGIGAMRFTVETLTLEAGGWRARVSFASRLPVALRIERRFALLVYGGRDVRGRHARLPATTFAPPLPRALRPGGAWRGTLGGRGVPPRGSYLRLLFGSFGAQPSPVPGRRRFSWVTQHVHRLRVRA